MTAIVLNPATGAVSEYSWTFQSMTDERAGGAAGLATLGGDTDAGVAITGEWRSGRAPSETLLSFGDVFVVGHPQGDGVLIVEGRTDSWEYPLAVRTSGVAKASPGRGIRENYIGLGYRNVAGANFRIDRVDAELNPSKTRRKV